MRFLVVVEETATGFSAYSPDLLGCVATGGTRDEAQQRISEAISFHLEGLRADGAPIPEPHSSSLYVDVPA